MKAMILAAGMGERLRPLTNEIPKPLVPVLNRPLIEYNLSLLQRHGIREVAVNLHYLGKMIRDHLGDGSRFGLKIHYSEEPDLLGTGGAIKKLRSFFGTKPFLVINADILIDIDLKDLVLFHRSRKAFATMILRPNPDAVRYGTIETDNTGRIREFLGKVRTSETGLTPWMFTGVHLFHPSVLDTMPEKERFCINRDVYAHWIRSNKACYGYVYKGYWEDLGTMEDYLRANLAMVRRTGVSEIVRSEVQAEEGVILNPPCLIGAGTMIGKDAVVGPDVVIGKDCRIGEGAKITESILWDGAALPAGAKIHHKIITRFQQVTLQTDEEASPPDDPAVKAPAIHKSP
ncbi:MAG: NDP-sugar synthase [Deltaproteobacteria bacterium]|nr:NDP-sugar synthase [Deltaproteobacteria bacterium]